MEKNLRPIKEYLPVQNWKEAFANLKRNWLFPISVAAFFCLGARLTMAYIVSLLIGFILSAVIASQIPSIWKHTQKYTMTGRLLALATALGICLSAQGSFYADWKVSPKTQAIQALFPIAIDIPGIVSVIGMIIAVLSVYFGVLIFWDRLIKILKRAQVFSRINPVEWAVYGILFAATVIVMVVLFAQTEAFYGTEIPYDIIYTSDSPSLVKGDVYLALTHPENDLRQPLFAVFSAPFTGIPYLVARVLHVSAGVRAMLVNAVQIIMLFAANLILAKTMRLDSLKRICFMVLTCVTYTQLLFTLMMEQYVVAYFWLVFCMYFIVEDQQPDPMVLWGAGGTLLTSMILLPSLSTKSPIKEFKAWFVDMVKHGLAFVGLMLVFGRADVIINLKTKVSFLSGFTGQEITMQDKLYSYTDFVHNCFAAPNAGVNTAAFDFASWQLERATGINYVGVAILLLAVISAIWNRDKKSSLLSVGWVGFSVVMLLVLGWGTEENGLILYSLYFGWAFLVLLFQLVEKIQDKLKVKFLIPVLTLCTSVGLLAINIPAVVEMVSFAITYYPT